MTVQLIEREKFKYAIGVDWGDHVSGGKAAKALSESGQANYLQLTHKGADGAKVHILGLAGGDRVAVGAIAAGLAVGMLYPSCVIAHAIGDGNWWIAEIIDGMPGAGSDRIVTEQEATDFVTDAYQRGQDTIIGSTPQTRDTLAAVLQSFEDGVDTKNIAPKMVAQMKVRRRMSAGLRLVLTLAPIVILAGGAAFWYFKADQIKRQGLAISRAKSQAALSAEEAKKAEEIARLRAQFQLDVESGRKSIQAQMHSNAVQQWLAWDRVRRSLPVSVGGFVPDAMRCEPTNCTVTWVKKGVRVEIAAQTNLPGEAMDPLGTASPRTRFDLAPVAELLPGQASAHDVMTYRMLLQYAVPSASVGDVTDVHVMPPAGLTDPPVVIGKSGTISYSAPGSRALVASMDFVQIIHGLGVGLVSGQFSGMSSHQLGVAIESKYVVPVAGQ